MLTRDLHPELEINFAGRYSKLEDRQKICTFALKVDPTLVGFLGALMKGMASIARHEMNSEVLHFYQL